MERSTGVASLSNGDDDIMNKEEQILNILKKYNNHPSIIKVKQIHQENESYKFHFNEVEEREIEILLNQMDVNVSTGEDKISKSSK